MATRGGPNVRKRRRAPAADSFSNADEEKMPSQKKARKGATARTQRKVQPSWRDNKITSDHIDKLEESSVTLSWHRIARRLHKEDKSDRPRAFTDTDIERLKKKKLDDDREYFREMINTWLGMSQKHTAGFLYDALQEENFGRIAKEVFCP